MVFAGPASHKELDRLRQGRMLYISAHELAGQLRDAAKQQRIADGSVGDATAVMAAGER